MLRHFEFDIYVCLVASDNLDMSLSLCNSNGRLWLNMFSMIIEMRLKVSTSNRNETYNTKAPNGNAFPNTFSLSSSDWINDIVYIFLWKVETISDNMVTVLDSDELLTILIISIIIISSDTTQWNEVIGNNSIDGVRSAVYINSRTYINLFLIINIIIQTSYDILRLNLNDKSNDTLPILLTIFQNIIYEQIKMNIDYFINVTTIGQLENISDDQVNLITAYFGVVKGIIIDSHDSMSALSVLIEVNFNSTCDYNSDFLTYLLEFVIDYIICVLTDIIVKLILLYSNIYRHDKNLYKYYNVLLNNYEKDLIVDDDDYVDSWTNFTYIGNVLANSYVAMNRFIERWNCNGLLLMKQPFHNWIFDHNNLHPHNDILNINFGSNIDVIQHGDKRLLEFCMDTIYDVDLVMILLLFQKLHLIWKVLQNTG